MFILKQEKNQYFYCISRFKKKIHIIILHGNYLQVNKRKGLTPLDAGPLSASALHKIAGGDTKHLIH